MANEERIACYLKSQLETYIGEYFSGYKMETTPEKNTIILYIGSYQKISDELDQNNELLDAFAEKITAALNEAMRQ